jgi:hypothetical protein
MLDLGIDELPLPGGSADSGDVTGGSAGPGRRSGLTTVSGPFEGRGLATSPGKTGDDVDEPVVKAGSLIPKNSHAACL